MAHDSKRNICYSINNGSYGLVQLGLMWRIVELGFGVGSFRQINP
jgi:hypothetical protein